MPWIKGQKVNKSKKLLEKQYVSKHVLNHISMYKIAKVLLHPWAEIKKYLSHKRTLWIEEPKLKFRKKASRRTQKRKKVQKHQKWKMAWERGINGYICLPYVTILWCLRWKLLKDRGKTNKNHIPGLKRVI